MKKVDSLLVAEFLSGMFFGIAYPIVHTEIVGNISSQWLSVSSFVSCILAALISRLWIKKSKKLYWIFPIMLVIEGVTYTSLITSYILGISSSEFYFIADAVLKSLIGQNLVCGATRLKSLRYNTSKKREDFDNSMNYVGAISSIVGYGISSFIKLPIAIGFVMLIAATIVDNVFYLNAYRKTLGIVEEDILKSEMKNMIEYLK